MRTDVDVQVDLEISCGAVNTARLEQALRNAEFEPDSERVWRWRADGPNARTVVRFELLADLDDQPAGAEVHFDGCEALGPANLRGTGFASRDIEVRQLTARAEAVRRTPAPTGVRSPPGSGSRRSTWRASVARLSRRAVKLIAAQPAR